MAAKGSSLFGWDMALKIGTAGPGMTIGLDKVVKRYSVEAAEIAKPMCPYRTGTLQKSLTIVTEYGGRSYPTITGKKVGPMTYLVGSGLPYAAQQEYEHATKSHFIHKGIERVRKPMTVAAKAFVLAFLKKPIYGVMEVEDKDKGCSYGYVTRERLDNFIEIFEKFRDNDFHDLAEDSKKAASRPSWVVTAVIVILSNLTVALGLARLLGK